jgi:hypothetical protein
LFYGSGILQEICPLESLIQREQNLGKADNKPVQELEKMIQLHFKSIQAVTITFCNNRLFCEFS